MTAVPKKPELDETTRQIAERMLRMPPKPHDQMKVGRRTKKTKTHKRTKTLQKQTDLLER